LTAIQVSSYKLDTDKGAKQMTALQYANSQFAWKLRMSKVCNMRPDYFAAGKAWFSAYRYMS
jgi:hypothetical protein